MKSMKFRPVGNESHAGCQTDGDNSTNSVFTNFSTHLEYPTSNPCPGPFCLQLGHKPLSK